MTKAEYDALQKALDEHLRRVLMYEPLREFERKTYKKAVMACKSVLSKNAKMDGGAE